MSDPKLISARDQIRAILDSLDIAGHVVLHNKPGNLEIIARLDPSYSKLIGLPPVVRLKSSLADYHGDREAQRADLAATSSMVRGIAEQLAINGMQLLELATVIDAQTGITHGPMEADRAH